MVVLERKEEQKDGRIVKERIVDRIVEERIVEERIVKERIVCRIVGRIVE